MKEFAPVESINDSFNTAKVAQGRKSNRKPQKVVPLSKMAEKQNLPIQYKLANRKPFQNGCAIEIWHCRVSFNFGYYRNKKKSS